MPSVTRSSRRRPRPEPDRAERRRQLEVELLAATERLMRDGESYAELGVERLAVAAGISRATFYVYFQDKSALLEGFAERVLDQVGAAAFGLWQHGTADDSAQMLAAVRQIIAAYRQHQAILSAVIEASHYDPQIESVYRRLIERNASYSRHYLEQGQATGRVRALDAAQTAHVLTWMMERSCHQLLRGASAELDERLAQTITEIVWGAIYLVSAQGLGTVGSD